MCNLTIKVKIPAKKRVRNEDNEDVQSPPPPPRSTPTPRNDEVMMDIEYPSNLDSLIQLALIIECDWEWSYSEDDFDYHCTIE